MPKLRPENVFAPEVVERLASFRLDLGPGPPPPPGSPKMARKPDLDDMIPKPAPRQPSRPRRISECVDRAATVWDELRAILSEGSLPAAYADLDLTIVERVRVGLAALQSQIKLSISSGPRGLLLQVFFPSTETLQVPRVYSKLVKLDPFPVPDFDTAPVLAIVERLSGARRAH